VAQELSGEERVAGRLAGYLGGELASVGVELLSGGGLHQRKHVLGLQAGEPHPLSALVAVQVGEQRRQRVVVPEIGVAVGADHHRPHRGGRRHDLAKQRQRRLIGPMKVVEDQKKRLALARALEQVCRGRIEQIALGLGIAFAERGQLP
jgi:hypothetical protein